MSRLVPLALVMVAACSGGGETASLPPAVTPRELLESAMGSPGDGSDILEVLEGFESAENSRRVPAGLVVSGRTLEAMARVPGQSRLVGTWRPVPTPEEEADIRIVARHLCSGPVDPTTVIQRAISGSTMMFEANGVWSSGFLVDAPAATPWQWKATKNGEFVQQLWLSESQFGPERTVSCEFASPDEMIVRDGLASFTRFVRVK